MEPPSRDLESLLPGLGGHGGATMDAVVPVRFVLTDANWAWYPLEFDAGTGTLFGFVDALRREFRTFTLDELAAVRGPQGGRVQRDASFSPVPLAEVLAHVRDRAEGEAATALLERWFGVPPAIEEALEISWTVPETVLRALRRVLGRDPQRGAISVGPAPLLGEA